MSRAPVTAAGAVADAGAGAVATAASVAVAGADACRRCGGWYVVEVAWSHLARKTTNE